MFSSQLFWRIFLAYAAMTVFAVVAFVLLLFDQQRQIVSSQQGDSLSSSLVYVEPYARQVLEGNASEEVTSLMHEMADANHQHLLVFKRDGQVVFDSRKVMSGTKHEELLAHPETVEASTKGVGKSFVQQDSNGNPQYYTTRRLMDTDTTLGFVRLSSSRSPEDSVLRSISSLTWLVAGIVVIATMITTYFVVGRIIRPLDQLTYAARGMAVGELQQEVIVDSRDELGILAEAFNTMSRELTTRIEELQRQGSQLQENRDRLATVLGGMIEGVIAIDSQQRIQFANQAAHELLEFESNRVIGKRLWEAVRNSRFESVVNEVLSGRDRLRKEMELPRSNSIVNLIATRLPGDPSPGAVIVLHDITEIRRLENIRREFVANVSHELKTPLAAIQGSAETLLDGAMEDPEYGRKFLQRILEHSERLHSLIMDMLRLARIESESSAFQFTQVDLSHIIEESINAHQEMADHKNIQLTVKASSLAPVVMGDAEGLRTILDNLVVNGIKYTPEGGKVQVSWHIDRKMVQVEVKDTGIGISHEHQQRIFERFYRVDAARSRELGGTGLGLSIVKHLAQMFDGSVSVESKPFEGSRFIVRLPQAEVTASVTAN